MGKSSVTNWICLKFVGFNFKKWFTFVKTLPSFNESGLRKKNQIEKTRKKDENLNGEEEGEAN